jgi:hypothetical protein
LTYRARILALYRSGFARRAGHTSTRYKDNIENNERVALNKLVGELLAYDDKTLARVVTLRVLLEVSVMKKQYPSYLMASIHETAEGLHTTGVMDKRTMREF